LMRLLSWNPDRSLFLSITQREAASVSAAVGMWATRKRCPSCPQPSRRRPPRARRPSVHGTPAPGEGAARCTTRFENAHGTARRAVLYRLHPWFGREVFVHGATDRAKGVFRCTLDGSDRARSLEIPVWMFDRVACVCEVRFAAEALVDLEALGVLSALLDHVLKINAPSSNARLQDPYEGSREQNRGESHGAEDDGVSDRGAAQAVSPTPADGFVCRPARGGGARLARPAGGRAGDFDRPDDAADRRTRPGGGDADNGGRP